MDAAGWLEYQWWVTLGGTRAERQLHRLVGRLRPRRILELQMGGIENSVRLLRSARRFQPDGPLGYTVLDQFDARPGAPLSLRSVHCRLHQLCEADVCLFPADHPSALLRYANRIGPIELLLVSADLTQPVWSAVARHLPHVVSDATCVLSAHGDGYRTETPGQLQARLGIGTRRLAA